jgi:hypothetical protein
MNHEPLVNVRIEPATVRGTAGFYRVGRSTQGRWWLISPDGRPMIYKGCNAALSVADTALRFNPATGRMESK